MILARLLSRLCLGVTTLAGGVLQMRELRVGHALGRRTEYSLGVEVYHDYFGRCNDHIPTLASNALPLSYNAGGPEWGQLTII